MSLLQPLTVRGVTLRNRVVVSPMSQYRAVGGVVNDWHFAHLARFALGGAGLVFTEATAVMPEGRRTHGDAGLWDDDQVEPMARIARFLQTEGAVAGVQLGHAGRKASERRPWHGETPVNEEDLTIRGEAPWPSVAPSAIPYDSAWPRPREMTRVDIDLTIAGFKEAARRALAAGFEVIEVYAAHGFLVHQFYSPLANQRSDAYGGSLTNRCRFAVEVAEAIREVWPDDLPLMFRLSATDWLDDGWTVADTVTLARALADAGVDLIDCSSGGIGGGYKPRMPLGPAFQADLAAKVKREAGIATMAVGLIFDPATADAIVRDGRADLVALARELLENPNWPHHAARVLGSDPRYDRWPVESGWWLDKRDRLLRRLGIGPYDPADAG